MGSYLFNSIYQGHPVECDGEYLYVLDLVVGKFSSLKVLRTLRDLHKRMESIPKSWLNRNMEAVSIAYQEIP